MMTEDEKIDERQLFRVSQKVIFYNENSNQFLIVKAAETKIGRPYHKEWMKKYGPWDLPGGHINKDESDMSKALMREIEEEVGVVPSDIGTLCTLKLMHNKKAKNRGLNIIYLIKYDGDIKLSEEHVEYLWEDADKILNMKDVKPWIKNIVQVAQQQIESQESVDRLHRCLADFDNYKKRQVEQQKEFTQYASEGIIDDMLPVLDNFHVATEHIPEGEADNPWVTGIMFIQQQMEKVFEERGVSRIEVKVGDDFDPNIMEAIKGKDDVQTHSNASVQKIAQPGYKIGEKVLRPVRVVLK